MCTLTWAHAASGYELVFNRDELRSRRPGLAPARFDAAGGVPAVAPRDGDHGGTWIAVNAHGLTLCLLNAYLQGEDDRDYRTRGDVIPSLIHAASAAEVSASLAALALDEYRGFVLAAVDANGGAAVRRWDGVALATDDEATAAAFLTSSSFDAGNVRAQRRAFYDAGRRAGALATLADRMDFHASHGDARSPYSVCMHRDDAQTVSLTQILVGATGIAVRYAPGAPCETPLGRALVLPRLA